MQHFHIEHREEVTSTNTLLKQMPRQGDFDVLIADRQTAGRGRMGRSFFSPDTGLYLSIRYTPKFSLTDMPKCSVSVATATALAIREITGVKTEIKWVNDLYRDGKKVCGILSESVIDGNSADIITGIGINLYTQNFPDNIAKNATSLYDTPQPETVKKALTEALLQNLEQRLDLSRFDEDLAYYREHAYLTGKQVVLWQNGTQTEATVMGIADNGGLEVEANGIRTVIISGDVTVRPKSS